MLERLTFGLKKKKKNKGEPNELPPPSPPTRYFSIQPWESEVPPPHRVQRGVAGLLTPVMTQGQESGCEKEPSTSRERVSSAWEPERAV